MSEQYPHEHWMALAIQQAAKGRYSTHPNPRVGCVIVKQGRLLASGFHEYPGGPHAEINALAQLGGQAQGCTVYVTLEPCSHTGKTPPCADALIKAQPERVVIAMQDPNPVVAGNGIKRLQAAGIEVTTGVLETQAQQLNAGFIKRMLQQMPFVRVKMAASLDGRTALSNGVSQWITGDEARRDVQFLRAQSSAIFSTAQTVIADDASLNVRLQKQDLHQRVDVRQPIRVVLDRELRLTGKESLFSVNSPIWILTCETDQRQYQRLDFPQVEILPVPEDSEHQIDLQAVLKLLAQREINEIHSECGATMAGALLKEGLVDELVMYLAPSLLGNQSWGMFDLGEISIMSDSLKLSIQDVRQIGDDIKITAFPEKSCLPS
jgi:diaminohydroxyphosphoribosylaminopyrimidine deaminase / 5-amino-6-(5-phosphoribosylamino)uracil reductase